VGRTLFPRGVFVGSHAKIWENFMSLQRGETRDNTLAYTPGSSFHILPNSYFTYRPESCVYGLGYGLEDRRIGGFPSGMGWRDFILSCVHTVCSAVEWGQGTGRGLVFGAVIQLCHLQSDRGRDRPAAAGGPTLYGAVRRH
jgi:hypothetical protein